MGMDGNFSVNSRMAFLTKGVAWVGDASKFKGSPIKMSSTGSIEIYSAKKVYKLLVSTVLSEVAII
jgi:hypothetical protein